MANRSGAGLPARIYLPIFLTIAIAFLAVMAYFVSIGFGVTGSVFGTGTGTPHAGAAAQGSAAQVEGGPPAAVVEQLTALRRRIARHPNDDVALTQLGDMYLAAGFADKALPLYRRALRANPHNVAAAAGLDQARNALDATR